jgi:hypothetical protein
MPPASAIIFIAIKGENCQLFDRNRHFLIFLDSHTGLRFQMSEFRQTQIVKLGGL